MSYHNNYNNRIQDNRQNRQIGEITAPFNFVPVSDQVFFPDWSGQISHDIPFSDGLSGQLDITITAQSPIFVRNGHASTTAKNDTEFTSFSKTPDGKYFIPATSIKGTIRNTLEIISFGKLSKVSDKRYGIRDLSYSTYRQKLNVPQIHCGWMKKENSDTIVIEDCGQPYFISHQELDEVLDTKFCETFIKSSKNNILEDTSKRTAEYKYSALFKGNDKTDYFDIIRAHRSQGQRKFVKFSEYENEGHKGTIVLTGQPDYRNEIKRKGKFHEFVFMTPENNARSYRLSIYEEGGKYEDFCFIYKDSSDWKFWKSKMNLGEKVPVFFLPSTDKTSIEHLGLSYMYKLPFPRRINEYIYENHKKHNLDLTDCIFGRIDSTKSSLKGRVHISHAMCDGTPAAKTIKVYLNSPKPTYYPIYMKQDPSNLYKTMLDDDAIIRGWKMYPLQQNADLNTSYKIPDGQEKNASTCLVLPQGTKFRCEIRFFNLRKIELEALICSIKWSDAHLHNIGLAKPYGFGKIDMTIDNIICESPSGTVSVDIDGSRNDFKQFMSSKINGYRNSKQIQEFEAMSKEQPNVNAETLKYMELPQFAQMKKDRKYLKDYTKIIKK